MNDFGIDLKGKHAVIKAKAYFKDYSVKDRTFVCESGSGCIPDPAYNRKIRGRWLADKTSDTVDSYHFEYVIGDDGKKIRPKDNSCDAVTISHVCPTATEPETPKQVRRKR